MIPSTMKSHKMKRLFFLLKRSALYSALIWAICIILTSPAFSETYEQTYYADGDDHFMYVYLQSGGTHSFLVNGVPNDTIPPFTANYNYVAYKNTGSGYSEIWSDSTSTGWDPTFSTYVSPSYKVKLVIYDGNWNVKSVYYWYVYTEPDPTATRVSPSSPITLDYGASQTFTARGQDDGDDLDYADWTLSGPENDTDHDYFTHSGDINSSYSHTFDIAGNYTLTCVFTDESGDSASVYWSINVTAEPDPTATRVSPSSPITLDYGASQTFTARGQDDGNDLDYADWTLSGPENDTDHDYFIHSGDINSSYSHTFDIAGDYTLTCVFTDESGDTASVSWAISICEPLGNLDVHLFNVNGEEAIGTNTLIKRYSENWVLIDEKNAPATWANIPIGNYNIEGYQTATFFGEEFWHSQNLTVTAGQTTSTTLTRRYPYAYEVVLKKDGNVLNDGDQIPVGSKIEAEIKVRNDVPDTSLSVQARLIADINKSASYDYDSGLSAAQTIGGSGSTSSFSFSFTPSATGQYYYALEIQSTLANGNKVRTDSRNWGQTFYLQPRYIIDFTVPTDITEREQQAQVTVRVKNSSGIARSFWVGLSFQHEDATEWPGKGWHDVTPQQTSVLANGEEEDRTFTFTIPLYMQSGQWYGITRVWDGYDSERYLMVDSIDNSMSYDCWNDDGRGERSFSLIDEPIKSTFIDNLIYWVGNYYEYPTNLADYYEADSKPLFFFRPSCRSGSPSLYPYSGRTYRSDSHQARGIRSFSNRPCGPVRRYPRRKWVV